jgi:molybdate transport system permease protein
MLGYRGKGRGFIDGILVSPLVLPPTVVGFLLLLLLGKNSPIGQFLHHLGINLIFSWTACIITAVVVSFPLMYRTSLGAFEQIEANILASARTLGASEWTIFWRVILPLSYRGIVAGTILAFARALGEFGATLMLAGNIPGQTQTMPLAIFFASESGDYQQAIIWVLILLSISLSVIIIVNLWAESKKFKMPKNAPIHQRIYQEKSWLFAGKEIEDSRKVSESYPSLLVDVQKCYFHFSLDVILEDNGQPLGLLGVSGSGKTMTLRCIAGLETPDRGHISVNGKIWFDSVKKINLPSSKRPVGFVFQNYALFPHITVWQNIAFGVGKLPLIEQKKRVAVQIKQMRLDGLENRYPHQLSGGQQQRVALARALAIEPEVLLLDEPFSALDTQLRSEMEKLMLETLATYRGITLLVSHNLEEIYRICQNLMVISEGNVLAYGDKHSIFAHPNTYEVARLTGCKNFSRARAISPHQVEALDWECTLNISEPIPSSLTHIGIRAHQLVFEELETLKPRNYKDKKPCSLLPMSQPPVLLETIPCQTLELEETPSANTFPCWLVEQSETPHRVTLYLKLNSPPRHLKDYHLQVELFKENWGILKNSPNPWRIRLESDRLFLLKNP